MVKTHLKLVTPATKNRAVTPRRRPNSEFRSREHLTESEVEKLIEAAKDNRNGHRDATMILVAYRHGLRASEVCDLRWEQIDWNSATLHVRRVKSGKPSTHPIRGDELRALRRLLREACRLLPDHLKAQVCRELDRLELLLEQIKAVEAERDVLLAAQQAPAAMLLDIKGIGPEFAAILWSEGLFRHFDNRRQVASYAGLAPTPWQSGSVDREQGVSKAGNPRLRTTLIQLAWLWLRHQPQSALALWFEERVRRNGDRLKKTTIVALARKLLVALWKYVTAGVVIEGAVMKAA
jgi:transposase